jgi:hypothetical protein
MTRRYQLCALAEPNTTVFENDVLTLKADRSGVLAFYTEWVVHTWLDDAVSGSQLFAVLRPGAEWPSQQNCDIRNLVIRDRLRVQELQLREHRAYVVTTNDEPKEGRDD